MSHLTFADQVALIVIAAAIGFFAKVGFDWLNSRGADTKGLLMTKASCRAIRDDCGIKDFKKEYTDHRSSVIAHSAKIDQQLCAIEKKLSQSSEDSKTLRKDIGEIKEKISSLVTVMEIYVNGQQRKDTNQGKSGS